jgi:hypothetical protein
LDRGAYPLYVLYNCEKNEAIKTLNMWGSRWRLSPLTSTHALAVLENENVDKWEPDSVGNTVFYW